MHALWCGEVVIFFVWLRERAGTGLLWLSVADGVWPAVVVRRRDGRRSAAVSRLERASLACGVALGWPRASGACRRGGEPFPGPARLGGAGSGRGILCCRVDRPGGCPGRARRHRLRRDGVAV